MTIKTQIFPHHAESAWKPLIRTLLSLASLCLLLDVTLCDARLEGFKTCCGGGIRPRSSNLSFVTMSSVAAISMRAATNGKKKDFLFPWLIAQLDGE